MSFIPFALFLKIYSLYFLITQFLVPIPPPPPPHTHTCNNSTTSLVRISFFILNFYLFQGHYFSNFQFVFASFLFKNVCHNFTSFSHLKIKEKTFVVGASSDLVPAFRLRQQQQQQQQQQQNNNFKQNSKKNKKKKKRWGFG